MIYEVCAVSKDGEEITYKKDGSAIEHYAWCVKGVVDKLNSNVGKKFLLPTFYKQFIADISKHTETKEIMKSKLKKNFKLTMGVINAGSDHKRLLQLVSSLATEDGSYIKVIERPDVEFLPGGGFKINRIDTTSLVGCNLRFNV